MAIRQIAKVVVPTDLAHIPDGGTLVYGVRGGETPGTEIEQVLRSGAVVLGMATLATVKTLHRLPQPLAGWS